MAELEAALALLSAGQPAQKEAIANIYKQLGMFGEHTWGLDVKTWLPAHTRIYEKQEFLKEKTTSAYQYMEQSWEEQRSYAAKAGQLVQQLQKKIEEEMESVSADKSNVIINANGTSYTGWAKVCAGIETEMELFGESFCFVKDVPPLSLFPFSQTKAVKAKPLCAVESEGRLTVENHRYRIHIIISDGKIDQSTT